MELTKLTDIESKEAAVKLLNDLTSTAMKLIRHAEKVAKKFELDFGFDIAYGMGGTFYGYDYRAEWYDDDELEEMKAEGTFPDPEKMGWQSSSNSC
jgi:hypothetical protein